MAVVAGVARQPDRHYLRLRDVRRPIIDRSHCLVAAEADVNGHESFDEPALLVPAAEIFSGEG